MTDTSISVVVPVYRCSECIDALCSRLDSVLSSLTGRYEIILVDDRSPDDAWQVMTQVQARFAAVKCVRLSRNFGQHLAISAGLAESRGDVVVVMDCDLQDPPERIPDLYWKMQEGYDLVLARRISRNHSQFRVFAANAYFRLLGRITDQRIDGRFGTFSILSRKVVDAFLRFNERDRHYLFILRWLGFNSGTVDYEHQERLTGGSSYDLRRLLAHAISGIFFQATTVLHWIVAIGLAFAAGGLALAAFYIYQYFSHGSVAGWTTVVVLILICTGVIVASLGVIGLYVGRIFDQTKSRPTYVVDRVEEKRESW